MSKHAHWHGRLAKLAVVGAVAAVAGFFGLGLDRFATLAALQESRAALEAFHHLHPVRTAVLYLLLYIAATALSVPGAALLTLAGGALFGFALGTLLASFAASIGATVAFLTARHLLRDWVRRRFPARLAALDEGIERDGALYLFTLRLVPAVPFFLVNLLMGLTALPTRTFYWVSQAGMLLGTAAYVNAGTELASLRSARDVLSPGLVAAFAALALLPYAMRGVAALARRRRLYRRWRKPARFDRNLVVIGAGAGGLVAAYVAAAAKAKVTLIEGHRMGGDCLNYGCVPSKALLRSAKLLHEARQAEELGIRPAHLDHDFAEVMERVQRVVRAVEPHDSVQRYTSLGVDVVQGTARIVSPWEVEVNGRRLSTRAIVIATGARPAVPPIPGIDQVACLTSDTVWSLRRLPRRLVVLGGGPIGCELAQAFARLGSQVTQVEMAPRLLSREDPEASALVQAALTADGVAVLTGSQAVRCGRDVDGTGRLFVRAIQDQHEIVLEFDELLCAVGRVARTEGFGLEELGISLTPGRTIAVDPWMRTQYPNIYACGDVAGPYQLTHVAAHQAWYAAVNALFGGIKRFKVDYAAIPWCTFTDPEVARVGLSEAEARERGIAIEMTRFDLGELDRAIADGAARGFVKVLTAPGTDRILGATIVGVHAGDLLAEYVLAMRHGLGLNKILATVHTYPTWSEANKYAAGQWRRGHLPARLLSVAEHFHAWRRRAPQRA